MKETNIVYVVGCVPGRWFYRMWSFQGVFETIEEALAYIGDKPLYFVGKAVMGLGLPHEKKVWEGCYYPNGSGPKRTAAYYWRKLLSRN